MGLVEENELVAIVRGLIDSTKMGTLVWQIYDDEGSAEFTGSTDRFVYYIKSRDEDDLAPYRFQIFKKSESSGAQLVLEHVTRPESIATEPIGVLFGTAKLSAFGIKSLKDEILGDLNLPF